MLRRLHHDQPESFAFTKANQKWAEAQITKFPEGRQASAVIPLLWRAQEQEGWLSRPAIEHIADMLGMAHIRALEVATFYFMFQLAPVGSVAHVQVCGTTSCMICGAEDLIAVCRDKIAANPHELSADGRFSWEEVECLGACSNAPMAQIGKDYYEDLTAARFGEILDELAAGKVPVPGPQNGRYASEPLAGLTSLTEFESGRTQYNASVARAVELGDTVKRIDGSEMPVLTPWLGDEMKGTRRKAADPRPARGKPVNGTGVTEQEAREKPRAKPDTGSVAQGPADAGPGIRPPALPAPEGGQPDDLKQIKGVGPALEKQLHELGVFHFAQVAAWGAEEVAWVDENLKGFKGRVSRDGWVEQARTLAEGGETEFSKRVEKGDIY
ncbi:NADH-quinone oxidoreductase subunit E [Maritimibacter sp. 55A14]|uniref:NADH-quinone oxidoreductase subunit E n=1 Tax=Maritimibacter sp. 55A14 TaxID=2174844 RepID=UPI000D61F5BB|nr:NADH-quinone oxidoreductase subunit E [Maritimibacter sp. 55A14]PWE33941.1 NADH-quinone oxidoreductase subunit E [Maritimibacter sp. 55A14]